MLYHRTPSWFRDELFPAGVRVPTPLAVFYFNLDITAAVDLAVQKMWDSILEIGFIPL